MTHFDPTHILRDILPLSDKPEDSLPLGVDDRWEPEDYGVVENMDDLEVLEFEYDEEYEILTE